MIWLHRFVQGYTILASLLGKPLHCPKPITIIEQSRDRPPLADLVREQAFALPISPLLMEVAEGFQGIRQETLTQLELLRGIITPTASPREKAPETAEISEVRGRKMQRAATGWGDQSKQQLIQIRVESLMSKANNHIAEERRRSGSLELDSPFYVAAREIVRAEESSWEGRRERELALELLALHYERNFIQLLMKDMQLYLDRGAKGSPTQGLQTLIYYLINRSLPNFIEKLNILLDPRQVKELSPNWLEKCLVASGGKVDWKTGRIKGRTQLLIALLVLGPAQAASIVFSSMLRICGRSGGAEITPLISEITSTLLTHLKHEDKISRKLPAWLGHLWAKRREEVCSKHILEMMDVGGTLVLLCVENCPEVFHEDLVKDQELDGWTRRISIKGAEMTKLLSNLAFNPMRLPMLDKPLNWRLKPGNEGEGEGGGYIDALYNELVNGQGIVHQAGRGKVPSIIGQAQVDAVNFLNRQPFEIHEEMLDHLLEEWERENSYIFGPYNKPAKISDEGSKLSNMRKKLQHNSVYWMFRNILNLARLFRGEVFYLPVFMDFRGRIYPVVNYLSYQGGDVARSLLCFHQGPSAQPSNPHGGGPGLARGAPKNNPRNQHLLIYFANVYGEKGTRENRIRWANSHIPAMVELYAREPLVFESKFLRTAKEPAQFMSCFLALRKAHLAAGCMDYHNCNVPVLFDATCSGMQHLSALTTDMQLAELVNLTQKESVGDFYRHCAEMVKEVIASYHNPVIRDKLKQLNITRKLVKIPVMTIPYNIGVQTLTDYITENFMKEFIEDDNSKPILRGEGLKAEGNGASEGGEGLEPSIKKRLQFRVPGALTVHGREIILSGKEAGTLGSIVYNTVKQLMPPLPRLQEYFQGMLKVLAKVKKPIFWITPAGMMIWGSDKASTTKRVKSSFIKNSKPVTIRIPSEKYDYKGINRALMANFIHSMDAANIHILIQLILSQGRGAEYASGANLRLGADSIHLYTIHDCFASVCGQMDIMEDLVRKAFSQLYFQKNYLEQLDRSIIAQIRSIDGVEVDVSEGGRKAVIRRPVDEDRQQAGLLAAQVHEYDTMIIPDLPEFNWSANKEILKHYIIYADYFIH